MMYHSYFRRYKLFNYKYVSIVKPNVLRLNNDFSFLLLVRPIVHTYVVCIPAAVVRNTWPPATMKKLTNQNRLALFKIPHAHRTRYVLIRNSIGQRENDPLTCYEELVHVCCGMLYAVIAAHANIQSNTLRNMCTSGCAPVSLSNKSYFTLLSRNPVQQVLLHAALQ